MQDASGGATTQRIDQWLWFARIVKSRTLAQALIERGKVRINRARIDKCSQSVKAGDVVTIGLGPRVRILKIEAMGVRRGPASEAAGLYAELTPAIAQPRSDGGSDSASAGAAGEIRPQGSGRPTKRDRRAIDKLKGLGR